MGRSHRLSTPMFLMITVPSYVSPKMLLLTISLMFFEYPAKEAVRYDVFRNPFRLVFLPI